MCGFAGFVSKVEPPSADAGMNILAKMGATMVKRGPDGEGFWLEGGVGFVHRRLAIIDLSPTGNQPMESPCGRYQITFNGEIYNYRELRQELGQVAFRGSSDTEVLLAAIEEWGVERALTKANGMFGFALWDRKEQELWLARDRMGEKPVAYGWAGNSFVFGSTLDALRAHPQFDARIDLGVLGLYFRQSYVPDPFSVYQSYRKLQPGTYLKLSLADLMNPGVLPDPKAYWSLTDEASQKLFSGSYEEAVEELDRRLMAAVSRQMVSDVPIGAFLSGGIDSSAVVSLMQACSSNQVKTFTISFEDKAYDEGPFAAAIAKHLGTDHTDIRVSAHDVLARVGDMASIYDEPFADRSQLPTTLVAQGARRQVTVALSGDGGDEMFCGYNRHVKLLEQHARFSRVPKTIRRAVGATLQCVPSHIFEQALRRGNTGVMSDQVGKFARLLQQDSLDEKYLGLTEMWPLDSYIVRGGNLPPSSSTDASLWPRSLSPMSRLLWAESVTSLPGDMLVKVDRAAMASSLEGRMPLLDPYVISFAWSLPDEFKVKGLVGKRVLRDVLAKRVPNALTDRPKVGFGVPVDEWMKHELRDWTESLLSPGALKKVPFVDASQVRAAWEDHLSGRKKATGKLWSVLMLQTWMEARPEVTFG